jgi:surface protein
MSIAQSVAQPIARSVAQALTGGDMTTTDFVMVMRTTTPNETVTIPCQNVGTFNAEIDWGDGSTSTITAYNDADLAHEYADAGDYTIRISGSFPNIYFNDGGDKAKVISVNNLGDVGWTTLLNAWLGCSNLATFTVGNTDTSSVTNISKTLNGTAVSTLDLRGMDVSSVTTLFGTFANCSNLSTINVSGWNTSSVTFSNFTFNNCTSLTSLDLSDWDTSNVTDIQSFMNNCTSLTDVIGLEGLDISGLDGTGDLNNFATGVTLPTSRYDATLIAWAAQTVQSGMAPSFGSSQYTPGGAAEAARTSLINDDGWTITDGGPAPDAYTSEATDYFTRAETLGGSFDQTAIDTEFTENYVKNAINTLIASLKSDGVWDKITELYLLCGVTFDGILAKLKYGSVATLTNNNFVSGDLLAAGSGAGLQGDKSTKYLDANAGSTNTADASYFAYVTARGTAVRRLLGRYESADISEGHMIFDGLTYYGFDCPTHSTDTGSSDCRVTGGNSAPAFVCGTSRSLTDRELYINGVSVGTDTTAASASTNSDTLECFRASSSPTDARQAILGYGTGLTDTDALNLSNRVNAFVTAIGANVY